MKRTIVDLNEETKIEGHGVKKMKDNVCSSDWYPVLCDKITSRMQHEEAYAGKILNKKNTSSLVRKIGEIYALPPNWQGLKRVRLTKQGDETTTDTLHILICPKSEVSDSGGDKQNLLDQIVINGKSQLEGLGELITVKVPSFPPLTRQQFSEASQMWPTQFHENKPLESVLRRECFSQQELENIYKNMKSAILMAEIGRQNSMTGIGAVIVDPVNDSMISRCCDLRKNGHPLQHCVMIAVDLVAKSQGKNTGAWDYNKVPDGCIWWRKFIEESGQSNTNCKLPYLCTRYDLYITVEPCIMCAMALVHSRIGRVFYGTKQPDGALGSVYKLNVTPALNHHYEVFGGFLAGECETNFQQSSSLRDS